MPPQNIAQTVIKKRLKIAEKKPLHRLAEHIYEIIAYPIFTIHILKRLPEHIRKRPFLISTLVSNLSRFLVTVSLFDSLYPRQS